MDKNKKELRMDFKLKIERMSRERLEEECMGLYEISLQKTDMIKENLLFCVLNGFYCV